MSSLKSLKNGVSVERINMPGILLALAVIGIYLGVYREDECGDNQALEVLLEEISRDESN